VCFVDFAMRYTSSQTTNVGQVTFLPSFLLSFFPSFLPSLLPFFLSSFLPSFLHLLCSPGIVENLLLSNFNLQLLTLNFHTSTSKSPTYTRHSPAFKISTSNFPTSNLQLVSFCNLQLSHLTPTPPRFSRCDHHSHIPSVVTTVPYSIRCDH
jgi:hypothetical protein